MKLLLDTHALIWLFLGDPQLTQKARDTIDDQANDVFASAVSAWEIATKFRLGKLPKAQSLATDFETILADQGIAEVPITAKHGRIAGLLTMGHKDPWDRMLIAQAIVEDMALISNEAIFDSQPIVRVWK